MNNDDYVDVTLPIGQFSLELYELDVNSYVITIWCGDFQLLRIEGWLNENVDFRVGFEAFRLDSFCFDIGKLTFKWDLPRIEQLRSFLGIK